MRIGKRARKKLQAYEQSVIQNCDKLITVSDYLKKEFEELGAIGKSYALTNGFDQSDFVGHQIKQEKKFIISYIVYLLTIQRQKQLKNNIIKC